MWIIFPGRRIIVEYIRKAPYIRKFSSLSCVALPENTKGIGEASTGKVFSHLPQNLFIRNPEYSQNLFTRNLRKYAIVFGENLRKYAIVFSENLRKYAIVFGENLRKYAIVFSENLRKYAIVGKEKALQRLPEYRSPCKAWHYLPLKCNFLISPPEPCRSGP